METSVKVLFNEEGLAQLSYETYWSNGCGLSVLREALGISHEEHLYNYVKRGLEGTSYKPEDFDIINPRVVEFSYKSKEELIDEILKLRQALENKLMYE